MKNINEKVLDAWVQLIMAVNSEKLIKDMPFNEAIICNLLYRNQNDKMTATQLCDITSMQKSQMNRTLTSMEDKKMIIRERAADDKRQVYITLNKENEEMYALMHSNVLNIVDKIVKQLDAKQIDEVINVFTLVSEIAKKEIK